jgi:CheY-like chemotaxis protein
VSQDWDALPGGDGHLTRRAGALGHDFNNVLTVIAGNLALAERHAAGNAKLLRLLSNMRLAAERGTALARELLLMARDSASGGELSEEMAALTPPEAPKLSRILLVEDDPHVAELALMVLRDLGHSVCLKSDAPAALAALRAGETFDLVFSDIVMPGEINGLDLAEAISVEFPRLPVLLATAYSAAALARGAMRFPVMAKPYSVGELERRVAEMLAPVA